MILWFLKFASMICLLYYFVLMEMKLTKIQRIQTENSWLGLLKHEINFSVPMNLTEIHLVNFYLLYQSVTLANSSEDVIFLANIFKIHWISFICKILKHSRKLFPRFYACKYEHFISDILLCFLAKKHPYQNRKTSKYHFSKYSFTVALKSSCLSLITLSTLSWRKRV